MTAKFITHARSVEQLREEFCSDLRRRIESLEDYRSMIARGAAEKARHASAVKALEETLTFWSSIELAGRRAKRAGAEEIPC